jgi:hypothetical protein
MSTTMALSRAVIDDADVVTVEALKARVVELEAELRSVQPPRAPPGWIAPKQAAQIARCSGSAIYKWARNGRIRSCKVGWRIAVDPTSLSAVQMTP